MNEVKLEKERKKIFEEEEEKEDNENSINKISKESYYTDKMYWSIKFLQKFIFSSILCRPYWLTPQSIQPLFIYLLFISLSFAFHRLRLKKKPLFNQTPNTCATEPFLSSTRVNWFDAAEAQTLTYQQHAFTDAPKQRTKVRP